MSKKYYIDFVEATKAMYDAAYKLGLETNQKVLSVRGAIRQVPFADVTEIKRGKWSDISEQACLCSNCGKPQNYKQAMGWRYCPHCGAVME